MVILLISQEISELVWNLCHEVVEEVVEEERKRGDLAEGMFLTSIFI